MRTNGGLFLIRIIQTFDVVEITDIESCNVICSGERKVEEATILGDVGAAVLLA